MNVRPIAFVLAPLGALLACGAEPDVAAPPPGGTSTLAGRYEVEGTTTVIGSGDSRAIEGSVVLSDEGDRYTATFHLNTVFPTEEGPLPAEVVGKGEGRVEGNTLTGSAETQILTSGIPGVDPRFPMLPQYYSARLVSESVATVGSDGSIRVQIENRGVEGEQYVPTRTVLHGTRVGPEGISALPAVSGSGEAEGSAGP